MDKQPDMEWFDYVISKLEDVDDVLLMEGHQKSHKKVSDAIDLLTWSEENLMKGALPCIASRHSTRKFKPEPIEEEKLRQVIEAGRQAPSGKNKQQNHFLVVRDKAVLDTLVRLVQEEFAKMEVTEGMYKSMANAIRASKGEKYIFHYDPAVLILTANRADYSNNIADCACVLENMMVMANALDLGSCWINQLKWLNENEPVTAYLRTLGLAQGERVYGAVSIGYAKTEDGLPSRKPLPRTGNPVTFI